MKTPCLLFVVCFITALNVCFTEDITEYIAKINAKNEEELVQLHKLGISLDRHTKRHSSGSDFEIDAYITKREVDVLDNLGIKYELFENEIQQLRKRNARGTSSYHHYDQLVAFLQDIATRYSNITRLFSIGKSYQNRDIWAIQISTNPGVNEPEPEFKYIANMHGDEAVGREMMVYLIDWLCSNYGSNTPNGDRASNLVNNTDIYIIPTMNPDGFERGTRGNSNGKDLNRDFPDQFTSPTNSVAGRQAEVSAVMQFIQSKHFVLSANFHGGAVVANYPYDGNSNYRSGQYTACPDDSVFKSLAMTYSRNHRTMYRSSEFTNGITNGADWYVLYGGMQDWNYVWNGVFEITLEISDDKYPDAKYLSNYWDDNRESILSYMELVHKMGVRGIVMDSVTNIPIPATIKLQGNNKSIQNDPQNGDYYRLLTAGTYTITAESTGYQSQSVQITIPANQAEQLVHDFKLSKL